MRGTLVGLRPLGDSGSGFIGELAIPVILNDRLEDSFRFFGPSDLQVADTEIVECLSVETEPRIFV